MTPELEALQNRVAELEAQLRVFYSAAEVDPQIARTISALVLKGSSADPDDYDRQVNEAGASTYNLPLKPDGFKSTPDGKLIPFYNPV